MSAALGALWLCLLPQADLEDIDGRLASEDYHAAWQQAEAEGDELRRWRGRARILYRAGDPAGALAAARGGLALAPDQLELLFHAAGAALWLQEAALAGEYCELLRRAVEAPAAAVQPEDQAAWRATAEDFSRRSQELARHEAARVRALALARAVSLADLAAALLLIGWAARRPAGARSG